MKGLFFRIISINIFLLITFVGFSQTVINYETWPNPSGCNVFATATNVPATNNGSNTTVVHLTAIGQPVYDNTSNKSVNLDSRINSGTNQGTEYRITANFLQGYSYKITISAARIMSTQSGPNVLLRLDLNNGGSGTNAQCNGAGNIDANSSGNFKKSSQITSSSFTNYVYEYNSLISAQAYLMVAAIPPVSSVPQTILIRKITIEQTQAAPTFTIASSATTISCGATAPITFTVTNVTNTPNVTSYVWNVGSGSTGWLYNGSAAPTTINTGTTNTLILTPDCGKALTAISATVTANGTAYNTTNSSSITVSQPVYSIVGPNALCSGSNSYTLSGLPCNASLTWGSSDATLGSIFSSGNPTTLTKQGTGNGRISITGQVNACGVQTSLSKSIIVGNPVPNGTTVTFQGSIVTNYSTINTPQMLNLSTGQNGYASFKINDADYSNHSWSAVSVDPGTSWTVLASNTQLDISIPYNSFGSAGSRAVTVRLNATGPCGTYFLDFNVRAFKRGALLAFSLSPNPTSDNITVSTTQPQRTAVSTTQPLIFRIKVSNQTGHLKKQFNYPSGVTCVNIDLRDLPIGLYIVEAFDGSAWGSQQLIKK